MGKVNIFGEKLRSLRKDLGISQKEFGNAIGIDQSKINKLEHGYLEANYNDLIKIANHYHVSIDSLLGLNAKKDTPETEVSNLGTDQRAIQKLAEKLDDAQASQVYNYMLFVIDLKNSKYENYNF